MQPVNFPLENWRESSVLWNPVRQDTHQKNELPCLDCGILCTSIGRMKNGWYTLCQCGTYMQIYTHDDFVEQI